MIRLYRLFTTKRGKTMLQFRLKDLMAAKGVSLRGTAKGAGIALSTLQKVAANENVESDVLGKLMAYFGCTPGELIAGLKAEAAADDPANEQAAPDKKEPAAAPDPQPEQDGQADITPAQAAADPPTQLSFV
jgi:DNA-binding Xre family transcriptional regulator